MEEKICFRSEVRLDLTTYQRFVRLSGESHLKTTVFGLIYIACMLSMLSSLQYSFTAKMVLALSVFSIGTWLFQWHRNRDGGIGYKRILRERSGQIPHNLITVDEGGITQQNLATGKEMAVDFASVREILESKQLLILVDDLRIGHIIDKSTLTGGSRDALVSFLRKNCPKMKKRIKTGRLGRVIRYLVYALAIFALAASLAVLLHIPEKLSGQITNDMPAEQVAEELGQLGIEISPYALDTILLHESSCTSFFSPYPGQSKALDMLIYEGMGQYDYDTWEWTPSESGVYWFDTEVMNVSSIYADFLRGVDAMDENLTFSNITEDYSAVDMESGMGIVTFSFDYRGQTYTLNAQYQYDWFDINMLFHLGRILKADPDPKALWYSFDGQGILLYYGTTEQMIALEEKTGIIFFDPVNQPLFG